MAEAFAVNKSRRKTFKQEVFDVSEKEEEVGIYGQFGLQ